MTLEEPLVALEELPELMRRYLAAYHAHQPSELAALYASQAEISIPGARIVAVRRSRKCGRLGSPPSRTWKVTF